VKKATLVYHAPGKREQYDGRIGDKSATTYLLILRLFLITVWSKQAKRVWVKI
jgi:hypothetical protein